jgi:hypothetical protein
MGHAAGVVLVAALAIQLREQLPPIETISAWSERLVGAALITVGIWALRRSGRVRPAQHAHGTMAHDHIHVQAGPRWIRRLGHPHASFCLGILHGIAGSAHLVGVLPALALPTRTAALTYIIAFGAGTVAAMTGIAAAAGRVGSLSSRGSTSYRMLMGTTAVIAIVVGGVWLGT